MRVHPAPIQEQMNARFRYDVASSLYHKKKQLRRLPHIFAKVLELPFHSNADVLVHETSDSLRFVITTDDTTIGDNIRAHSINIHPGITKIVVRGGDDVDELSVDDLELDVWRFRLPDATLPELASAAFRDGELVVVVPKGDDVDDDERWSEKGGQAATSVQFERAVPTVNTEEGITCQSSSKCSTPCEMELD
ncbi:Class I heat shock protein [Heracleum sosnowskyi]|uniref:Class I heat shock protein n=1 Tax=Heracleum sosnowskyi TaxID=360622 RepID=A0AAD8LXY5_9APIA|nr:Class I heat shock protein [Heracleum sosnowskyi]